jgi:DNA repair exonuclease SbcCD ATPase subunit
MSSSPRKTDDEVLLKALNTWKARKSVPISPRTTELQDLQRKIKEFEDREKVLLQKLQNTETKVTEKDKDVDSLTEQNNQLKDKLQAVTKQYDELQLQLDYKSAVDTSTTDQKDKEQKQQIKKLKSKNNQQQQEIETLTTTIKELKQKIQELGKNIDDLKEQVEEQKRKVTHTEQQYQQQLKQQQEQSEKHLQDLQEQMSAMEDQYSSQNLFLLQQLQTRSAKEETSLTQQEQHEEVLQELREKNWQLQTSITEKTLFVEKVQLELSMANTALVGLQLEYEALERQQYIIQKNHDEQLQSMQETCDEKLRVGKLKADKEKDQLQDQIDHLQGEMAELQDGVSQIAERLDIETNAKRRIDGDRRLLQEEVERLKYYFQPSAEQEKEMGKRHFLTQLNGPAQLVQDRRRIEIQQELDEMAARRQKALGKDDLKAAFPKALQAIPAEIRTKFAAELEKLMKAMGAAKLEATAKLQIIVSLAEHVVDLGIMHELTKLTLKLTQGGVHPLHTAESLVKLSLREASRGTKFKEALLRKVAEASAQIFRKPYELVLQDIISYKPKDDDDDEGSDDDKKKKKPADKEEKSDEDTDEDSGDDTDDDDEDSKEDTDTE